MILSIFAVRDQKTDSYGTPMFLISAGQAVRSFTDEINRPDKDSQLYNHPEDFEMFFLGSFDTSTGMFSTAAPSSVAAGSNLAIRK